jgi:valyl-tRNA synthetase
VSDPDTLPKNYEGLAREQFWQAYWAACGVYKFEPYVEDPGRAGAPARHSDASGLADAGTGARATRRLRTRDEIFSIDTPPPTVSGKLHIGHVYSYTQTDMNARYQRMRGKHVFYPFGFDDNGLPTERLVETVTGKRANDVIAESGREAFIELCKPIVAGAEQEFIALWQSLALSCDWDQFYTTINERSRAISQASFIDLYNKGFIYRKVAPTQWDWVNQTAIAQAEIEDREVPGHFHDIKFGWANGPGEPVQGELIIATTRPELIPACVAVFAHPDDERYQHLFGKVAITPLFEVEVPILPSEKANPEKGTGILMCCTFGDMDDVEHWQEHDLPTRIVIQRDGRVGINSDSFLSVETIEQFQEPESMLPQLLGATLGKGLQDVLIPTRNKAGISFLAQEINGLKVKQAREKVRELLRESGELLAVKDIMHTVRHAERGDVPVEILVTPQWYVNILDHKEELLAQGRKVKWHPEYMLKRYEQWVEGLNTDWCISRQRYNGVPFPVWYKSAYIEAIAVVADVNQLPVNPLTDLPTEDALKTAREFERIRAGFTEEQISESDFEEKIIPDPDVMDTWATSSCTPLLNTHLLIDRQADGSVPPTELFTQLFPFDMRPQAHDIIRTWAFYTIAKAYFHFGEIPWKDIVISGHAQDAAGKKISKSKGHVVTPAEMVTKYTADGLRYWSGSVKLGADTLYDETKLTEGRKLINKLFNATKFALRHLIDFDPVGTGGRPSVAAVLLGGEVDEDWRAGTRALPSEIVYPTDLWLIGRLNDTIERATRASDAFEFGDAKQAAEDFFWSDLCDNYLELSKGRLYGEPLAVEAHSPVGTGPALSAHGDKTSAPDGRVPTRSGGTVAAATHVYTPAQLRASAQATLHLALSSVLRLFAPVLPHITEECWSWHFARFSDKRSIHEEAWPTPVGTGPALSAHGDKTSAPDGRGGPRPVDAGDAADLADAAGRVPTVAGGRRLPLPEHVATLLLHTVAAVRKWKSEQNVSVKKPLRELRIYPTEHYGAAEIDGADLHSVLGDLLSTCNALQAFRCAGPPPDGAVTTERGVVAVVCELVEE